MGSVFLIDQLRRKGGELKVEAKAHEAAGRWD